MKKISTTTAKAFSKMQKLTIGLDLAWHNSAFIRLEGQIFHTTRLHGT